MPSSAEITTNTPPQYTLTFTPQQRLNASLGVVAVFVVGVFLDWFPITILHVHAPGGRIAEMVFNAVWQVATTVALPCIWAIARLRVRWSDLGIRREGLLKNAALGCTLYSLALAAFLHCSSDPMISRHAVRFADPATAATILASMSLIAASTDIITRGFILLMLAKYSRVWIAVVVQNLAWVVGHLGEIAMLKGCLGVGGAVGLTITLGLLGDVIALRTRNVIGLALAHVLLNVILVIYIRHL